MEKNLLIERVFRDPSIKRAADGITGAVRIVRGAAEINNYTKGMRVQESVSHKLSGVDKSKVFPEQLDHNERGLTFGEIKSRFFGLRRGGRLVLKTNHDINSLCHIVRIDKDGVETSIDKPSHWLKYGPDIAEAITAKASTPVYTFVINDNVVPMHPHPPVEAWVS